MKDSKPDDQRHDLEEGREEVHLPLQPQLAGMVWQLPAVAHQGGQGVCNSSLPHPSPEVISLPPSHLHLLLLVPLLPCLVSRSSPQTIVKPDMIMIFYA